MKKSIRAVLLVFLSMVLMFGSVTSVWGFESSISVASRWFQYSPYSPYTNWQSSCPEDVRDFFDYWVSKADLFNLVDPVDYDIVFHDFSWEGRTLIADVSIDYHVKHYNDNSAPTAGPDYGNCRSNVDFLSNGLAIVITEKDTGNIVTMGRVGDVYRPKFAEWYMVGMNWCDVPTAYAEMEYTLSVRKTTEITMPVGFDPTVHDVKLCVTHLKGGPPFSLFPSYDSFEYPLKVVEKLKTRVVDTSGCYMPTGDVDGNGITNLRDVSAILQHIANWELDGFNKAEADFDCDGTIDLFDARMGMKIACGWDLTK